MEHCWSTFPFQENALLKDAPNAIRGIHLFRHLMHLTSVLFALRLPYETLFFAFYEPAHRGKFDKFLWLTVTVAYVLPGLALAHMKGIFAIFVYGVTYMAKTRAVHGKNICRKYSCRCASSVNKPCKYVRKPNLYLRNFGRKAAIEAP